MTASESNQLAALKQEVTDMKQEVKDMKSDQATIQAEIQATVNGIKETLDNLSGGKTALMYITGIFIAACGLVISWLQFSKR